MKSRARRLIITTGDSDGIGLEVTLKALRDLSTQKNVTYFVYLNPEFIPAAKKILRGFRVISTSSFLEANGGLKKENAQIYLIGKNTSPPEWVEEAAFLTREGSVDAMVTAPLSKTLIQDNLSKLKVSKFKEPIRGHTEILQLVDQAPDGIHMVFLGSEFNVFLGTAHVPLQKVSELVINPKLLKQTLKSAEALKLYLKSPKPIGVLGLNPHAGESGLLGSEDGLIKKQMEKFPGVLWAHYPQILLLFKVNAKNIVLFVLVPRSGFDPVQDGA